MSDGAMHPCTALGLRYSQRKISYISSRILVIVITHIRTVQRENFIKKEGVLVILEILSTTMAMHALTNMIDYSSEE